MGGMGSGGGGDDDGSDDEDGRGRPRGSGSGGGGVRSMGGMGHMEAMGMARGMWADLERYAHTCTIAHVQTVPARQ
jgi:hypothetical protein